MTRLTGRKAYQRTHPNEAASPCFENVTQTQFEVQMLIAGDLVGTPQPASSRSANRRSNHHQEDAMRKFLHPSSRR